MSICLAPQKIEKCGYVLQKNFFNIQKIYIINTIVNNIQTIILIRKGKLVGIRIKLNLIYYKSNDYEKYPVWSIDFLFLIIYSCQPKCKCVTNINS